MLTLQSTRWAFFLTLSVAAAPLPLRADYPLPPSATGRAYVSSFGTDEIFCYAASGEYLFKFEHEDLRGPRGLAFAPSGELYAAAQLSSQILVFDREGTYLRQFTTDGLSGPTGIAFAPDGRLYVSSFSNGRVYIFDADASTGFVDSETANVSRPNCVAFGPEGDIYVANQFPSHVGLFNPGGDAVDEFSDATLSSLMGVAVYDGLVYVTGGASHNVGVFDLAGQHVETISSGVVLSPQGIAFDAEGNYTISSFSNGKVATFSRDGTLLFEFESAGVEVARSIAFEPLEVSVPFIRGDFNRDSTVDISDGVAILKFLFLGAAASRCRDAADVDDNSEVEITDTIALLNHLFLGGGAPPEPFPTAGEDPTEDGLGCEG